MRAPLLKSSSDRTPMTPRSWLPDRQTAQWRWASSTQASGSAPAPVGDYCGAAEFDRARRFRRGQRAFALASGGLDTAILVALVRRPPRGKPAVVAAGMGAAMTAAGLPLSAVARARGVRVG